VLGAEGYVFELERRGYIKAGPFVPEVVLDFPGAVRELHREFLRAGAEVMVALTYYAHREKLRDVGREQDLEAMNRHAVRIAREVAAEGDALVAGNVCNTWAYDPECAAGSGPEVQGRLRVGGCSPELGDLAVTIVADVHHRNLGRLAPTGSRQRAQHRAVLVVREYVVDVQPERAAGLLE
jgi:NDP-sugar pyrophosphorylase family protein